MHNDSLLMNFKRISYIFIFKWVYQPKIRDQIIRKKELKAETDTFRDLSKIQDRTIIESFFSTLKIVKTHYEGLK